MSEEIVTEAPVETAPSGVEQARQAELAKFKREESLRRDLQEAQARERSYKEKLALFEANGWDTQVLSTKKNEAGAQPQSYDVLQKQIRALNDELKASEQRRMDNEQLSTIMDVVSTGDEFELIKAYKAQKAVQELIKYQFQTQNKLLSESEAAELVEKHLEKVEEERSKALSKTKKGQKYYKFDTSDVVVSKDKGVKVANTEPLQATKQTPPMKENTVPVQAPHSTPWVRELKQSQEEFMKELAQKYRLS